MANGSIGLRLRLPFWFNSTPDCAFELNVQTVRGGRIIARVGEEQVLLRLDQINPVSLRLTISEGTL